MKPFKPTAISLALLFSLAACQNTPSVDNSPNQSISSEQIIKSQSDQRQYQYMLLDNGLKVLMISDPTTEKSAAAMDISVGAFHSPEGREGLLHFLEHMLFLGTEKYPDAGEYNKFLKENGGSSNAYTAPEDTNYFFDVKNEAFDEALDRFAQFFIAPTMERSFVEREKNAVDSEYSVKIKEDSRRIREASRQAVNNAHPYSKFSVGNLNTLADREDEDVYDALLKAYNEHYSAHRMSLVVLSNSPLSEVETMVRSKFSAVKNNGKAKPVLTRELLTEKEKATRVTIEPLREMRLLTLTFPISDTHQYRAKKPLAIVSHLLGHEGENSLYSRLNKQGLIESLSAYKSDSEAMDVFKISVELTPSGIKDVDGITEQIFQYIDLIKQKGVTQAYYNEIKDIAKLDFTFQEKGNPMSTVYQLAPVLQNTPPRNLLNTDYQFQAFDAELTHKFLTQLSPYNMQQTLVSPNVETDQHEPLYDVGYAINKIAPATLEQWQNASADATMQLPALNPFIAEDISVRSANIDTKPEIIVKESGLTLWHYQDTSFNMPKSSVYMRIESPFAGDNVKNRAQIALADRLIEDKLNAYGYNAKLAGLSYGLFSSNKGLGYTISGYNDKQLELIKAINKAIIDFDINQDKFDMIKESLVRDWKNSALNRPINQVFSRSRREFGIDPYSNAELADALEPIHLADLKRYMNTLLSDISIKVLTHGNTSKNEAISIASNLRQSFIRDNNISEGFKAHIRQMDSNENEVVELDIAHDDSAIVVSYPMQSNMQNIAKTQILGQVLSAAFFNELRTKQQLGYIVGASGSSTENLPTLNFYVQSSKVGPVELEKRINKFIESQYQVLADMSDADFEKNIDSLLTNINKKDKNLLSRTSRLWGELATGYTDFNRRELLSEAVTSLTKDDLVHTYKVLLIDNRSPRLVTRNFGQAHREENYTNALQDTTVCREELCWDKK
ncbi:insulinase family protein [Thalassotalea profundi]|uniref:Protease 3 n=1 Tax=Thalassotalea profundi TaxID=2036687 RepID=A0ABQ3IYC1_9GAMM|nr:insulinase family protein [Thalassotalea profundi]GHE97644.1 protease III [Thalassotalea profundi]